MKSPPSVLVVGSANTDMSIKIDRLPRAGETILGGEFVSVPGGKGANQAVSASRAGADVTFIGRIGCDAFGDSALAGLTTDGVNVNYIIRDQTSPSGVALILVGANGENSIAVAPGANGRLSPADLRQARQAFVGAGAVVLQLEIPLAAVEAAANLAAHAGARLILNPAPARVLSDRLLRRVSVLTPNQIETEVLTGIKLTDRLSTERAGAALLARGVQNAIITLGADGACVCGSGGSYWIPGHKVKPLDTTAAGDVFNGALAAALAGGKSLVEAARFANAAAAISVTRMGAQRSAPFRLEIEQMLAAIVPSTIAARNGRHRPMPRKRAHRLKT